MGRAASLWHSVQNSARTQEISGEWKRRAYHDYKPPNEPRLLEQNEAGEQGRKKGFNPRMVVNNILFISQSIDVESLSLSPDQGQRAPLAGRLN